AVSFGGHLGTSGAGRRLRTDRIQAFFALASGIAFAASSAARCKMNKSLFGCAAGLLLMASAAVAAPAGQGDRKDFQVAKDIATSVQRYAQFTIFDDVH